MGFVDSVAAQGVSDVSGVGGAGGWEAEPAAGDVDHGRLDTDLLITRTTQPLRVPAAALLRLAENRPPGDDATLNIL